MSTRSLLVLPGSGVNNKVDSHCSARASDNFKYVSSSGINKYRLLMLWALKRCSDKGLITRMKLNYYKLSLMMTTYYNVYVDCRSKVEVLVIRYTYYHRVTYNISVIERSVAKLFSAI